MAAAEIYCGRYLFDGARCQRSFGHKGVCAYEKHGKLWPMFSNQQVPPMEYETVEQMRSLVSGCDSCKRCPKDYSWRSGTYVNPRFGTGNTGHRTPCELMVIGNMPNEDPEDRLHGAYNIHYRGKRKNYVYALVSSVFGYRPSQVYATNALKCARVGDIEPTRQQSYHCAELHLRRELAGVRAKRYLIVGMTARDVMMCFGQGFSTNFRTWQIHQEGRQVFDSEVRVVGSMIFAPNPNIIGINFTYEAWAATLLEAFTHVNDTCYGGQS